MFRHLLKFRYLAVVMVILSLLNAVAYLVIGGRIAIHAYAHILAPPGGTAESRPGLQLLDSLDFMFVAMVLVVLGLGIAKIFLLDPDPEHHAGMPGWLRIESLSELKVLLWETILTTLLIAALSQLVVGLFTTMTWTVLLMPVAILILAMSLFFMKRA